MSDALLPEHQRHLLGQKLAEAIRVLIEVIALLDDVQPEDVFEEIVEHYVAARIITEAQEGNE